MPARLRTQPTDEPLRLYDAFQDFEGVCQYVGRADAPTLPEQPAGERGSREHPIDLHNDRGAHDPHAKRVLVKLGVRPSNGHSLCCAHLPPGVVYAHAYESTLDEIRRNVITAEMWETYDAAFAAYRSIVIEKLNASIPARARRTDGKFAQLPHLDPASLGESPEALMTQWRKPFKGALYFAEVLGDAPPISAEYLGAQSRLELQNADRQSALIEALREDAARSRAEMRALIEAITGKKAKGD